MAQQILKQQSLLVVRAAVMYDQHAQLRSSACYRSVRLSAGRSRGGGIISQCRRPKKDSKQSGDNRRSDSQKQLY